MRELVDAALQEVSAATTDAIGVDLEEVSRWRAPGLRRKALFSTVELAHADRDADPAQVLAGLWCAKEAVFKAISADTRVTLRDIEIVHDPAGAPVVRVAGRDEPTIRVSIAHSSEHAVAVAVRVRASVSDTEEAIR